MRTYTVRDVRGERRRHPAGRRLRAAPRRGRRPDRAPRGRRRRRSATGWSRWRRGGVSSTAGSSSTPARAESCCWRPTRPPYRPCAASSRTCRGRRAASRSSRCRSRATCWTPAAPEGCEVVWLPRDGAPLGSRLHEAVLAHLGTSPHAGRGAGRGRPGPVGDPDVLLLGRGRRGAGRATWATTSTGSTPGSRGSPAWSPPCAGTWSRSWAWTAARSPSWATGGGVSRCVPEASRIVRRRSGRSGRHLATTNVVGLSR